MILLGIGANLPSSEFGSPPQSFEAALRQLGDAGVRIIARSRWYRSAPVPVSDQPFYVNGVVQVATTLEPPALLDLLHGIEARFGRVRAARNAPRPLDLDLLAYDERVSREGDPGPQLPHPRLHLRAFVLRPLAEVAPDWRHPRLGLSVAEMLAQLPPEAIAEPVVLSG